MQKILSLEDLENAENKTLYCTFDEKIEGVDCVTPIHAELCAKSLGDFVEISGNVKGKVNLDIFKDIQSWVGGIFFRKKFPSFTINTTNFFIWKI